MLSEKQVAMIIKQILSAINYGQARGIYHLDLKPENILVNSKQPD
jgi:calcium-dependent protein kinase